MPIYQNPNDSATKSRVDLDDWRDDQRGDAYEGPLSRTPDARQRRQIVQNLQIDTPSEPSVCSDPSVWHGNTDSVRRLIFRLCRHLKSQNRQADDVTLAELFAANEKGLDGLSRDDFRLMMMEGIELVQNPIGEGPLAKAIAMATSLPPPTCAARYDTPAIQAIVALCQLLHNRDEGPFFLAADALALEFKVDSSSVSRWLRLLVRDGVLAIVEKGRRGRATTYCFQGDAAAK